ncbi:glycosyltransferase family 2 protein [Candidatus Bathyarchaeota archaeon]|nr:MAG: glycosyltransferase family 2 protein [Candidatus Bathyarchaeota archaeon]
MIVEILNLLLLLLTGLMIAYLIRHYIFTLTVLKNTRKHGKNEKAAALNFKPTVSILVPAHNEENVIGRLLDRLTELTYPEDKTQIIVIDDASTDSTGEITEKYAKKFNHIKVLHRNKKEGGRGKAAALNAGLKHATGEIILCFDADYYPQRDIVEKLTREFIDPKVGAVQGRVTVLNEPQNIVTRFVALERIGGYRVDQKARDYLGLIPQFGGTVGGFRRSLLESLGGWDEFILAEDTDLTFQVYLAGYKVRYVEDAECYEEAVENWRDYWKQRYRWAKGHMQTFFKHWLKVLKSKNLTLREKADGLLLLNVYFMPILVLLSWIISILLFSIEQPQWSHNFLNILPIMLYSSVGNFAPFFEIGIGAYLDGRTRAQWLIPLLIFTFLINTFICTKALVDLTLSKIARKNSNHWEKTNHSGNGNCYITNISKISKDNV